MWPAQGERGVVGPGMVGVESDKHCLLTFFHFGYFRSKIHFVAELHEN